MGVSGSGKTTIGRVLSERTGFEFYDGDDYHPESNVAKMTRGEALSAEDRVAWIDRIIAIINARKTENKVIACSALTKSIRNKTREQAQDECLFVYLKGDFDTLKNRLDSRKGHFMKAGLLASQLETLEEPEDALTIDIENSTGRICELIVRKALP